MRPSALRLLTLALPLLLSACASSPELRPFHSDGCSLFPDRAPSGGADWCGCCVAHDLAYWQGGTAEARQQADEALQQCVRQASGSEALADLMFAGVRVGGSPYLPTPFRWGYGWSYGRFYQVLTSAEATQAAARQAEDAGAEARRVCPQAPR